MAKLLITKDKDGIFVEYTVVAMVHMIYTKGNQARQPVAGVRLAS